MRKLVKEIAKREGKKSEVAIGNIREITKVMVEIFAEELIQEELAPVYYAEFLTALNKKCNSLIKKRK